MQLTVHHHNLDEISDKSHPFQLNISIGCDTKCWLHQSCRELTKVIELAGLPVPEEA